MHTHLTWAIFHKHLLTMTDLRISEDSWQTSPLKLECELLIYLATFLPRKVFQISRQFLTGITDTELLGVSNDIKPKKQPSSKESGTSHRNTHPVVTINNTHDFQSNPKLEGKDRGFCCDPFAHHRTQDYKAGKKRWLWCVSAPS